MLPLLLQIRRKKASNKEILLKIQRIFEIIKILTEACSKSEGSAENEILKITRLAEDVFQGVNRGEQFV